MCVRVWHWHNHLYTVIIIPKAMYSDLYLYTFSRGLFSGGVGAPFPVYRQVGRMAR